MRSLSWRRLRLPGLSRHLEARMMLQAAAAALLPMLALGALALYTLYDQQMKAVQAQKHELALRAELLIEETLAQNAHALRLAGDTNDWRTPPTDASNLQLYHLLHHIPAARSVSIVDAAGRERHKVSRLRLIGPRDLADLGTTRAFLAARQGNVGWSAVSTSENGEPMLRVIVPLAARSSGEPTGYLSAVISLRSLWDRVTGFRMGTTGTMYVVDAQGAVLAHPDLSFVLSGVNLSRTPMFASLSQRQSLPDVYTSMDGARVLGSAAAISGLGWWVVVEQAQTEALAPVRILFGRLLVGMLLAIVASAIPGWMIARSVTHPIAELSGNAIRVGQGDLTRRSTIHRDDEIGQLATAFNQMVDGLQGSTTRLEQTVAERTKALRVALRRAEEADRLKTSFLGTVTHELRTPLASIKGFAETLLAQDVDWDEETRRDFLQTIVEDADRLHRLVNQLLDMTRIEAGALRVTLARCDVRMVLRECEERLRPLLGHAHELIVSVSDDVPPVLADREHLVHVLRNLVENAVKYTPAGTRITVSAQPIAGGVQVSVRDTGPGIAPELLPHIFDRFHRGEHPDVPGTGLGLAICRGLIESQNGRIWVETSIGQGSTFHFMLPAAHGWPEMPAASVPSASDERRSEDRAA